MSRLLLCGLVTWLMVGSTPARADDAEDKAVALAEKLKGKVTWDENLPGKPVISVNLYKTAVPDADLKEFAALKNLTYLDLSFTKVTDAGVKELQKALPNCTITK